MTSLYPQTYSETLRHLYPRTNGGIKLGLTNTEKLLAAVGDPQHAMAHIVVAGTNGKGSTSSLIAEALSHAGYRVGLYTSPHLLRFTERIKVNGQEITEEAVVKHYQTVLSKESRCDYPPTFFEVVTAMTLLEFQARQVDIAVLEVGLGGRLDSTNVVQKDLAVLTPIALDHQQFLGDTLAAIAKEKAGIIPHHGRAVTAPQPQEVLSVLEHTCKERETTLQVSDAAAPLALDSFPAFQQVNIHTAFTACLALNQTPFQVEPRHFQLALESWRWPGRFHSLGTTPEIILDGAHNPHAISSLLESLPPHSGPFHAVFSATTTKDAAALVALLANRVESLHLCPSSVPRSLSFTELQDISEGRYPIYQNSGQALATAKDLALAGNGIVLVTGSLFLVADVLHSETRVTRDPPIAS